MSSEGDNRRTALPEVTTSPIEGRKDDAGKERWDLVPWNSLREVVSVLTYGAAKYKPGNWKRVADARERYFAAVMRHLVAWENGERADAESKLPHLAHAACCLLFLLWFENGDAASDGMRRFLETYGSAHLRPGERDHA